MDQELEGEAETSMRLGLMLCFPVSHEAEVPWHASHGDSLKHRVWGLLLALSALKFLGDPCIS